MRPHPPSPASHAGNNRPARRAAALAAGAALALGACRSVGPDYTPPDADEWPTVWKHTGSAERLAQGDWWKEFGDSGLNKLIAQLEAANPDAAAALARVNQSRAALGIAKAGQFPGISADGNSTVNRDSANAGFQLRQGEFERYRLGLNLDYEVDIWGRVRRLVEGAKARNEAADALYANALLSLKAELTRHYFSLRELDAEIALLDSTVELRREGRELIAAQAREGETSELDLARAVAELETARADAAALRRQRAALEAGIAALVGQSASDFSLPPDAKALSAPPKIPAGVPSELLSRRPDVAAAERDLAAASADVGVAIAETLPSIRLTGVGGLTSLSATDFFNPASRFFEIGPQLNTPTLRFGLSEGNKARARAKFDEALAAFRASLVAAFRDTETALSALKHLADELAAAQSAADAAAQAAKLSRARYDNGLVSYLEVIDSERTRLAAERRLAQVKGQRLQSTAALVQALGGGWR
ncbi:MAG: efflux transporter outer membrane subunit [Verrucomicrobiales bacterium]